LLVKRSYEKLIFLKQPQPEPTAFSFYIPGPGRFEFKQINCAFNVTEHTAAEQTPAESPRIACLDADKIVYPLEVRNFRPGDRFVPLGMQSEKKLKNFFIDLKIPREQRRAIPILLSNQTIVWISSYRIDDRFKITPQTRRILRIEMEEMEK
jgi:tRNA(Ile)-lysidine synthase